MPTTILKSTTTLKLTTMTAEAFAQFFNLEYIRDQAGEGEIASITTIGQRRLGTRPSVREYIWTLEWPSRQHHFTVGDVIREMRAVARMELVNVLPVQQQTYQSIMGVLEILEVEKEENWFIVLLRSFVRPVRSQNKPSQYAVTFVSTGFSGIQVRTQLIYAYDEEEAEAIAILFDGDENGLELLKSRDGSSFGADPDLCLDSIHTIQSGAFIQTVTNWCQ